MEWQQNIEWKTIDEDISQSCFKVCDLSKDEVIVMDISGTGMTDSRIRSDFDQQQQ